MQLDMTAFPIIRVLEHDHGEDHDDAADREAILAVLERGEPFVIVMEKMPDPRDMARESPESRRERALMFKRTRADFARLCRGFVIVGGFAGLPLPIRKAIEGMTRAVGVEFLFATDVPAAMRLAADRLGDARRN